MQYSRFSTPLGKVHLLASAEGLVATYFDPQKMDMERRFPSDLRSSGFGNLWLLRAEAFLACYFEGDFAYSGEIPLDLRGTPFQQEVWGLLREIPAGATRTYGELADILGRPSASRAVGAAVGRNPVSIIVPCHRVVGSNGKLTGYAGGVERKRQLLLHEGAKFV